MDDAGRMIYEEKSRSLSQESEMRDPLADIIALLKPQPSIAKLVTAGGRWLVERRDLGSPFYCAMVEGRCRIIIDGQAPRLLSAGDFLLVPDIHSFTMTSLDPPPPGTLPQRLETSPGVFRLGAPQAEPDVTAMVGHCIFAADDRALLVSLLPGIIHLGGDERLMAVVRLIHDETVRDEPARDMILGRLLDVLLLGALRNGSDPSAAPGLIRGLSDPRLAPALRLIHADPAASLGIDKLADAASLSRSAFFERFRRQLGLAPMDYVMQWRMALAKDMLRRRAAPVAEIAARTGYGSASAFSVAFARHVGTSPGAFAQRG